MAAGDITQGRRLTEQEVEEAGGLFGALANAGAGAFYGPVRGFTGERPAVFYLLPNARDEGAPSVERSIHHVTSPPHVFTENPDGTITVSASILSPGGWHGYLESNRWREV